MRLSLSLVPVPGLAIVAVVMVPAVVLTAIGQATPPVETELVKLTASDGGERDKFGFAVDVDGETLAIGAPNHYFEPTGLGSVYVFVRDGAGGWAEPVRIFASDDILGAEFGHALAIDGDTMFVGAPFVEDAEGSFMGAVYVLDGDEAGVWTETTALYSTDLGTGGLLGEYVALDGDTAVATGGGAVHVFTRDQPGTWSHSAVLTGVNPHSVDMQGDTIISGGTFAPDDFGVMVFGRDGGEWSPQASLPVVAFAGDFLLISVAVDGDVAVIGATSILFDDDRAYAYTRDEQGSWSQSAVLDPVGIDGANFGRSVDVAGNTVIVGASHDGPGSASVFSRDEAGTWSQVVKLVPSDTTSNFGFAVSLDEHGTPVAGAWADHEVALYAGSAYVFNGVLESVCSADLDGDGGVGIGDFLQLLGAWGTPGGDVNGDGSTDITDFLQLLGSWGPCP